MTRSATMRPQRMALRFLGGVLAVAGLVAMHGITASTASAQCATAHAVPVAAHAESAAAHAESSTAHLESAGHEESALVLGTPAPDRGHPALLCIAILAAGALLLMLRRLGLALEPVFVATVPGEVRANGSRSPPTPELLGRWRN